MPPIPVLIALSDSTRCQIIAILRDGPQPVHAISGHFDISRPAISRHLRVLKQAGLISEGKKGRENLYRVHLDALVPLQDWLATLRPTEVLSPETKQPTVTLADRTYPASADGITAEIEQPKERARRTAKAKLPLNQMGFEF